jgi:hypothetical protein
LAQSVPSRPLNSARALARKARQLTDVEKASFVDAYQDAEPIAEIAKRLNVHRTTLDTLVRRLELNRADPREVPEEVRVVIVNSYRAGESLVEIGAAHRFSANKIRRILAAAEEPVRPRGPKLKGAALSDEQIAEAAQSYQEGSAIGALATRFEVSYAAMRKTPIAAGVEVRARGGARR